MVDCPTSGQQKQACWEAGKAQLLIKNCMQWKQLAQAGRRNVLLSEGDPVRPAEGKKLTEKQEAWPGHSGRLIGKYSSVGLKTGVQIETHRVKRLRKWSCLMRSSAV